MSESKSAKLVVIFIVAIVAFGISSVVALATGDMIGLNIFNSSNDTVDSNNSSNPFNLDVANSSNDDSSNSYSTNVNNKSTNNKNNSGNEPNPEPTPPDDKPDSGGNKSNQ